MWRREALAHLEGEGGVRELLAFEDGVAVGLQQGATKTVDDVAILPELLEDCWCVALVLDEEGPDKAGRIVDEAERVACTTKRGDLEGTSQVSIEQLAWSSSARSRLLWDGATGALAEGAWLAGDDGLGRVVVDLLDDGADACVVAVTEDLVHVGCGTGDESHRRRLVAAKEEVAVVVDIVEADGPCRKLDARLLAADDDLDPWASTGDEGERHDVVLDGGDHEDVGEVDGPWHPIVAGDMERGGSCACDDGGAVVGDGDFLVELGDAGEPGRVADDVDGRAGVSKPVESRRR